MRKQALAVMLVAFAAGVAAGTQNPAQDDNRNDDFFGPAVKITTIKEQLGVHVP